VLESNARIIFIVNDIKLLEESVIRRFSFSIHFKPFSRAQGIQLWKNLAQNQKIEEALTDAQISELASTYIVSPGVIEQSLRTASRIAASSEGDLYKRVLLSLRAHEGLLHGGHKQVRRNVLDKDFVLEGLHVSGAELDTLIKDLKAFNEYIKNSGDREAAGMSLLFHGVTGSGKSYLGKLLVERDLLLNWQRGDQCFVIDPDLEYHQLAEALGGQVEQYYALESDVPVSGKLGSGEATVWAELLKTTSPDGEVLLRYGKSNGWLDGQPCVVTRRYGRGQITYVGAPLSDSLMAPLAEWLSQASGVQPVFGPVADGVEVNRRVGENSNVFVLINFNKEKQSVALPHPMRSLLDQKEISSIELPQYGVVVLLDQTKR